MFNKGTPLGGIILTREDKLIKRMEQGDTDAMEELVTLYYPEILRYCLWHAPARSLAEDAVQETFLKAIRYFDRYSHRGKFKAFLYQIASNTCVDMHRKKWITDVSLECVSEEFAYTEDGFEVVCSDMEMQRMIKMLPREQQEVIILRFAQDLTLREISGVMGIPLRTVQSRLRAALKQIKKSMNRGGQQHE